MTWAWVPGRAGPARPSPVCKQMIGLVRFSLSSIWCTPIVGLVSFAGVVATGWLFDLLGIFPPVGFRTQTGNHALDLFGAVALSPVGETLIMAAVIAFSGQWLSRRHATLVGAFVSIAAHAPAWWGWSLAVTLPFALFAAPFALRTRWREAITLSMLTHAFHNLYAFFATTMAS